MSSSIKLYRILKGEKNLEDELPPIKKTIITTTKTSTSTTTIFLNKKQRFKNKNDENQEFSGDLMISTNLEQQQQQQICIFFSQKGYCKNGEKCSFVHGNLCDLCNKAMLIPGNEEQNQDHFFECLIYQENQIRRNSNDMKQYECEICFEPIVDSDKKFGLLSNCNHKFCLPCIRSWRVSNDSSCNRQQQQHVKKCPTCRTVSHFIIPSDIFVIGDDKEDIIKFYKLKLSKIPCKYYLESFGNYCKFGEYCMYNHGGKNHIHDEECDDDEDGDDGEDDEDDGNNDDENDDDDSDGDNKNNNNQYYGNEYSRDSTLSVCD